MISPAVSMIFLSLISSISSASASCFKKLQSFRSDDTNVRKEAREKSMRRERKEEGERRKEKGEKINENKYKVIRRSEESKKE